MRNSDTQDVAFKAPPSAINRILAPSKSRITQDDTAALLPCQAQGGVVGLEFCLEIITQARPDSSAKSIAGSLEGLVPRSEPLGWNPASQQARYPAV